MLTNDMLSILCCPTCRTDVLRPEIMSRQVQEGILICDTCNESYPVQSGIPDLMPHGVLTTAEWQMWKAHLAAFQERREQRVKKPDGFVSKWGKKSKAKKAFSQFVNITQGNVLDMGCGAGKFRYQLNKDSVTYYGLDPMIVPGIESFPFVRALAEYIPFKDGSFSHIIITAALDHFRELERFFGEATRVLKSNGIVHIMQSVHGIHGPKTAVKALAHCVKDSLEDIGTKSKTPDAPHHMSEFNKSSLFGSLSNYFEIIAVDEYTNKWYSPNIVFLSMRPKHDC